MNHCRLLIPAVIVAASVTGWAQQITNPGFATDLSGWTTFLSPEHSWSSVDFHSSTTSGSLLAYKDYAATHLVQATQCVTVVPGMTMRFRVRVFVLEVGGPTDITIDLSPASDAACATITSLNRVIETPTQGEWTTIVHGPHVIPEGVNSVLVALSLSESSNGTVPVSAHFDDAEFILFENGFETATCLDWSLTVPFCITPDAGLRVELTWDTPGDPDQGDDAGTDLDLHLRHPDGEDSWGGAFDCSAANPSPGWGAAGTDNDPELIFEDDDGAGPEAIQVTDPESVEYDIGVHYVDDLAFGGSSATVRVFVDGSMVYEYEDKALVDGDFWHLGGVVWPAGTVTVVDTVSAGSP